METTGSEAVRSRRVGDTAVIYAGDYLNKLSGERVERECKRQLESGCRALVISFRDTELVNSIGVSILMGVIDAAQQSGARLIFSDVDDHTANLFEMLGLTRDEILNAVKAKYLRTGAVTKTRTSRRIAKRASRAGLWKK